MIKILFICHGNICRSTMAEFVMKDLVVKAGLAQEIEVASAATSRDEIGSDTYPDTKKILKQHQVPYTSRRARQMTMADYQAYDYIVAMDRENLHGIQRIIGEDVAHKVSLLLAFAGEPRGEVADPWYTRNFNITYDDVLRGCEGLLRALPIAK